MSRSNVETVQRALAAWSALDAEAATAVFDPAVRWHVAQDEPDARVIQGIDGVVQALRGWMESFDDFRVEPQRFIDRGDYVVVPVVFRGQGRSTAANLALEEAQVHLVRDGRIAEVRVFRRLEDALAAAGLDQAVMSRSNVEIVHAMYEAANTGDKLDADFKVLAPDVTFHVSGAFPDLDPVYKGHEGVARLNHALSEPWATISLHPEKIIDAGSRVLVLSRFHARGRDGMDVTFVSPILWTVQDGQIVRVEAFADEQRALEAVGRSEPDAQDA